MRHLNKIASLFCLAALATLSLTGCEGGDLYKVDAPDWISEKADSIRAAKESSVITYIPNPAELGNSENTTPWWTEFTDDVKVDSGQVYQIPFTNYGGNSNWNNFVIILRNETKDFEYAVLRADNWGWGTGWAGEDLAQHCDPNHSWGEDWSTWLKAMNRAECTATITNNGNGTADVRVVMNGSDGVTYKQDYLNIAGIDKDDFYFAFTVDNCHLVFGTPTKVEDSQPASLKLLSVPHKVLLGNTFEEAFANVSAEVKFENGLTKTVSLEELQVQTIPDMETLGTKTLVAVYNKTYLDEGATQAVIATQTFTVVDKMYTTLGATDNSTGFWGAHSTNIKVAPGETFVSTFTNYTSGGANWNNFIVVLTSQDGSTEYGVLRADNWGWGTGWPAEDLASKCTPSGGQTDWGTWLAAMDGAKVTIYVTNNGDGTADVKTVMLGNDGVTYKQDYIGLNTVTNPDDFYFHLTIDGSHLEFDDVLGEEDNTTGFWGAHSPYIKVPAGQTCTRRFVNYTSGGANWNNFITVLTNQDGSTEYGVLRADNWGWGTGWPAEDLASKCTPSGGQTDWGTWLAAMDEATVTVSVTNNGNGTADVKCTMVGNDGVTYKQDYIGLNTVTEPDNFYMHFTVDGCHLVFE